MSGNKSVLMCIFTVLMFVFAAVLVISYVSKEITLPDYYNPLWYYENSSGEHKSSEINRNYVLAQKRYKKEFYNKDSRLSFARINLILSGSHESKYYAKSEEVLKETMEIFNHDCFAPNMLGKMYLYKNDDISALKMFLDSANREPYYLESIFMAGICMYKMGYNDKALLFLNELKSRRNEAEIIKPVSGYAGAVLEYDGEAVRDFYERLMYNKK